jgi:hypothetical protein
MNERWKGWWIDGRWIDGLLGLAVFLLLEFWALRDLPGQTEDVIAFILGALSGSVSGLERQVRRLVSKSHAAG